MKSWLYTKWARNLDQYSWLPNLENVLYSLKSACDLLLCTPLLYVMTNTRKFPKAIKTNKNEESIQKRRIRPILSCNNIGTF